MGSNGAVLMDPDQTQVAQRFARDLVQLRQFAGRPSYSTLERVSTHQLRRATMSDVLNANRVNLPDWRFVAAFVTACRAAAQESGLDPRELGTVADWKRHWDLASSGVIDARFPGRESRRPVVMPPPGTASDDVEALPASAVDQPARVSPTASVWGLVPPRLTDFVGRETLLASLRRALAAGERTTAVAIQGLCGTGKTQIAAEYAHRYVSEYDLVWWISCDDTESADAALADLQVRLGLADVSRAPGESRHAALYDVLQGRHPYPRWLLIFDNANEPTEIRKLIPPGNGHVIITTRNSRWEATAEILELDTFTREESIEFLRRRMRRFSAGSAHRLADAVGDLPLALEHAVESQIAVSRYIVRLRNDPINLLDSQPSDYPATIAGEWRAAISRLPDDSLDLLRCLCFFGDDPIPRDSLERGGYLQNISVHDLLLDEIRRIRAIMELQRAGLLRVRADARTLEVHRIIRDIVRHMVAISGASAEERWKHDVHLLLAAAAPVTPEDPANWRRYDELRSHAVESDAEGCSDKGVRKLIVNLALSLSATGDPRAALTLADNALRRWSHDGAGRQEDSAEYLAMYQAKADALLASGQREPAFELQRSTLAMMRSNPDTWAEEIIFLNRMTGVSHRLEGRFRDARRVDQESEREHIERFGVDHPQTFPATNNLITDLVLNGQYADAAQEAERVYLDCKAFYGDDGYPSVLFERNVLGRCHWLSGQYREAVDIMVDVHKGYAEIVDEGFIDKNHPWLLAHEIDYALARRDKGLIAEDLEDLAIRMHDVRRRCWQTLGADHPQTQAAAVTLGSILRRISGRVNEATEIIAEAERRYWSTLAEHPYSYACRGQLIAMRQLSAATHRSEGAGARSVAECEEVVRWLQGALGEDHPYVLAEVATLANLLADAGQADDALARCGDALAGFQRSLGAAHPHSLACAANAETVRTRLGHGSSDVRVRIQERYAAAVGAEPVSYTHLTLPTIYSV